MSEPEQPGWRRELWPEEYEESRDDADEEEDRRSPVGSTVLGTTDEEEKELEDQESYLEDEARDREEDSGYTLGLEPRGTTRKRDNKKESK